jgi:pyridoxine/pyridoxamine 5'-phosphate oxidase
MFLPQGDTRLLDDPIAQSLLTSTELARVAYTAKDGTPRVIPMLFHWDGTGIVLPTFAQSHKIASMRRRPAIAVTIDRQGPPPEVLMLRGTAEIVTTDGVAPEYALAQRRYYGDEQGAANTEQAAQSGAPMARIVLRPAWVGLLDFQNRFPGALAAAGVASEDGS